MAQDGITMKSDKVLDADLNKATSFQELQELLHRAVERSPELGITRDPVTGQFVTREKEATAAAAKTAADAAPHEFKQTVQIYGHDFSFVADSAESLERQISSARSVAEALTAEKHANPRATGSAAAARNAEQDVLDKVEADMALRRGEITTAEYLERTHAIEDALAARGVDVAKISQDQLNRSWADATETFLQSSDWPGGQKNMYLVRDKIAALGLVDATDKVAALRRAYRELKEAGTLFDRDHSPEEMEKLTANMSPVEIIQAWKQTQTGVANGDSDAANQAFIDTFRDGRSSGLFNK